MITKRDKEIYNLTFPESETEKKNHQALVSFNKVMIERYKNKPQEPTKVYRACQICQNRTKGIYSKQCAFCHLPIGLPNHFKAVEPQKQ